MQADVSNGQHLTLEDYKEKYLRPVWENMTKDDKIDDFKELLKVPTLFRMIVARRFTDFERTKSVAELYGRLFHSLLSYKAAEPERMVNLVKKYEDFAIRIFNYDDDTCPFTGKKQKTRILYLFYTKKGREDKETGAEGRLGFPAPAVLSVFPGSLHFICLEKKKNDFRRTDIRRGKGCKRTVCGASRGEAHRPGFVEISRSTGRAGTGKGELSGIWSKWQGKNTICFIMAMPIESKRRTSSRRLGS